MTSVQNMAKENNGLAIISYLLIVEKANTEYTKCLQKKTNKASALQLIKLEQVL